MMTKAHLARFVGQTVAVETNFDIEAHVAAATKHLDDIHARLGDSAASQGFWPADGHWMNHYRPYSVTGGVLQVPVKGMLLNDFPYADGAWATGYEYIREALRRGLADDDVHTIALMVNSGGGIVTGCFELADEIRAARDSKRIVAYVNDHAYSAAYAITSSATEVVTTRTGGVGSIGVLTYHIDASGAYAQMGLDKTYIHIGAHKVEGNETEPLKDEVRQRIESRLAAAYDVFVRTVALGRGLDEQAVRDTEALTYPALAALDVGLSDRIGTYDDAILAAQATPSEEGDFAMAGNTEATKTFTEAEVAAARAEGRAEGVENERARIAAILGSDEAKSRPAAAHQAAFTLGLDIDTAATFLASMPVEVVAKTEETETTAGAAAPAGMFAAAMEASGGTGLSASVETEVDPDAARVDGVFALLGKARV